MRAVVRDGMKINCHFAAVGLHEPKGKMIVPANRAFNGFAALRAGKDDLRDASFPASFLPERFPLRLLRWLE